MISNIKYISIHINWAIKSIFGDWVNLSQMKMNFSSPKEISKKSGNSKSGPSWWKSLYNMASFISFTNKVWTLTNAIFHRTSLIWSMADGPWVTVMLVTLWWWLSSDVDGRIIILATFFRYGDDFLNVLNRSPTIWTAHQHLKIVTNKFGLQNPSPTSM